MKCLVWMDVCVCVCVSSEVCVTVIALYEGTTTVSPRWATCDPDTTQRLLKADLWLWRCEQVYFFFLPALAHQLWPFLESIQTQNKSVAFLSERRTHFLIKGLAWTVRRVQECAQCLSPYTLTPTAPHLCRYDRSLCRGAKVKPRSDCSDFVDHSKDATLGARAQPLAHTEPDYNLCIGNTVCAVPTCSKSTLDGTK